MPDVPAIAETLPGYEVRLWNGLLAPAKTPPEVIDRLNRAIKVYLTDLDPDSLDDDDNRRLSEIEGSNPGSSGLKDSAYLIMSVVVALSKPASS